MNHEKGTQAHERDAAEEPEAPKEFVLDLAASGLGSMIGRKIAEAMSGLETRKFALNAAVEVATSKNFVHASDADPAATVLSMAHAYADFLMPTPAAELEPQPNAPERA